MSQSNLSDVSSLSGYLFGAESIPSINENMKSESIFSNGNSCANLVVPLLTVLSVIVLLYIYYYSYDHHKHHKHVVDKDDTSQSSDNYNGIHEQHTVSHIDADQFYKITDSKPSVVVIVSDRCSFCQRLKPNYEAAAKRTNVMLHMLNVDKPTMTLCKI